jgi:hypothetical protein
MYTRTFVSKKLPGICIVAIEFEIRRKTAAKFAKTLQQLFTSSFPCNPELAGTENVNLDLVTLFQFEHLHNDGRKTDSETVPPFANLHVLSPG